MENDLRAKGKSLVKEHYDDLTHSGMSPGDFLKHMKMNSDVDTYLLQATKHIKAALQSKKTKFASSNKKTAKFNSIVVSVPFVSKLSS